MNIKKVEGPVDAWLGEEAHIIELVTITYNTSDSQLRELRIRSPMLINALRCVVKDTDVYLDGPYVRSAEPYRMLYSHEEDLRAFKDNHPETHSDEYKEKCNEHIDKLLKFLDGQERFGRGLHIERARWRMNIPTATFRNIWLLLRPGELAFVDKDDKLEPYIIRSVSGGDPYGTPRPYDVLLWNMDCDGIYFGRSAHQVSIEPFDGEMEVTKLKVFPARFHPRQEDMNKAFIARGKKFFQLLKGVSFKEYTGPAVHGDKRKYERARIIIDYGDEPWLDLDDASSWHRPALGAIGPDSIGRTTCHCEACEAAQEKNSKNATTRFEGWDRIKCKEKETLTDGQYLLCSRLVWAYILKAREWRVLDVDLVQDTCFDSKIMDRLVMDKDKKRMIQAICREYTTINNKGMNRISDIISGKGQGKIFLLHGSPGVGKTLTAECVAEYTHRPLLSITAGDIGVTARDVQAKLNQYFTRAENWHAVLLLDEADIYLERRGRNDLERNSVVSVFLRELEYYQGILFITSNRVGWFDEAFKSRIHMSIFYKAFDKPMRDQIWDDHFDRIITERKGKFEIAWSAGDYVKRDPEVAEMKLNGREIRNAFQTAVTLAEYDAQEAGANVKLEGKHLEQVIKMSKAFEQYLTQTHKGDDAWMARASGYRADDFDEDEVLKVMSTTLSQLVARKSAVHEERLS
ncbi:P-loop containing nucleoside triphosphate hydrolase protein [Zopfia rhizophila CBS 207.26]|uniref:P-loop containing nucleoside triphosphate hydrolase protein n=1 Tax=Zopfia rhizophila CBS 207.26 TaxID=1314779 RepID=A0A6A6DP10_9PEZI|nr:P-loop containing nucleoside triphosphate hydrolase protein [Zopfia rhizophila CBS 207.26]